MMDASLSQLRQLLELWGQDQVILVGNSSGGSVAMEFALAFPHRVKALVLVSPAVGSGATFYSKITWLIDSRAVNPASSESCMVTTSGVSGTSSFLHPLGMPNMSTTTAVRKNLHLIRAPSCL